MARMWRQCKRPERKVNPMSYTFTVRSKDGQHEIIGGENVPDGEHQISGHEDPVRVDLSVLRRGPDGRFIATAAHSHNRVADRGPVAMEHLLEVLRHLSREH